MVSKCLKLSCLLCHLLIYSFLLRCLKYILLLYAREPWGEGYIRSSGKTKKYKSNNNKKKTCVLNMSVRVRWTAHIQRENCADDSDANKVLQQRPIVLLMALAWGLKIVSGIDKKRSAGEPLTWRTDVPPRMELSWIAYEPWGVSVWCQSHLYMYACAA